MTELDLEEEVVEEVEEEGDRVLPHDMESSLTDVPFNLMPLSGRDQTRKVGFIKLKARRGFRASRASRASRSGIYSPGPGE